MPTRKNLHDSWRAQQFKLRLNDDLDYCRDYGGYNPECFSDSDDDYDYFSDLNRTSIGTLHFPKDEKIYFKFEEDENSEPSDLEKIRLI